VCACVYIRMSAWCKRETTEESLLRDCLSKRVSQRDSLSERLSQETLSLRESLKRLSLSRDSVPKRLSLSRDSLSQETLSLKRLSL